MDPQPVFDPLTDLRDIHLPDPISWWPPAPGWWIALIVLLGVLVYVVIAIRQWLQAPRRTALQALSRIETANIAPEEKVKALSILLRWSVMTTFSDRAGTIGEQWLSFLNTTGHTSAFTDGIGRCLLDEPYKTTPDVEIDQLVELIRAWIKQAMPARGTH